jgi:hypothetical protein
MLREPAAKLPTAEELRQKMQQLIERKGRYRALQEQLLESSEKQVSLTDPDSRSMPVGLTTEVSYNVQTAVDAKHKLIVAHEVTNAVIDREQLAEMAIKAKEALGVKELEVIADMGYSDAGEIKRCEDQGITAYVAQPQTSINQKKGLYPKRDFTYLPERDCYLCPAGAELGFRFASHEKGRNIKYYARSACQSCQMTQLCTTNKGGRRISRLVSEEASEKAARAGTRQPGEDAPAAANRGASVRDDQAGDEQWVLFAERVGEGQSGDELNGPLRQHQTSGQHLGRGKDDRGGGVSIILCKRGLRPSLT